jgi:hypothetical protein
MSTCVCGWSLNPRGGNDKSVNLRGGGCDAVILCWTGIRDVPDRSLVCDCAMAGPNGAAEG